MENDISDIYLQLHNSFEDETKCLVSTHLIGAVMKDQLCFLFVYLFVMNIIAYFLTSD